MGTHKYSIPRHPGPPGFIGVWNGKPPEYKILKYDPIRKLIVDTLPREVVIEAIVDELRRANSPRDAYAGNTRTDPRCKYLSLATRARARSA